MIENQPKHLKTPEEVVEDMTLDAVPEGWVDIGVYPKIHEKIRSGDGLTPLDMVLRDTPSAKFVVGEAGFLRAYTPEVVPEVKRGLASRALAKLVGRN